MSTAAVTIALPILLARRLDRPEYGVWVLVIQLSTYLTMLDLGMQTAVGRHIAAVAGRDRAGERSVVSSAMVLSAGLAAAEIAVGAVLVAGLPVWWEVPPSLASPARLALVALGAAVVLGQLVSTYVGQLVGRQRTELSAVIMVGSNAAALVGVWAAVAADWSLAGVGAVLALGRGLGHLLHLVVGYRVSERLRPTRAAVRRHEIRLIVGMTGTYLVFNLGLLLVSGMDTVLVAWIQFDDVAAYGVAASGITFLAGLLAAASSPLLAHTAARRDTSPASTATLVLRASRIANAVVLATSALLFLLADDVVRIWVGSSYLDDTPDLLRILVVANTLRLLALPLVTVALGQGDHKPFRAPAIAEGLANLAASITLGLLVGTVGVALGTVVGSTVSLLIITVRSMPRTPSIALDAIETWWSVLAPPLVVLATLLGAWGLQSALAVEHLLSVKLATLAAIGVGLWWGLLDHDDRSMLLRPVGSVIDRLQRRTIDHP